MGEPLGGWRRLDRRLRARHATVLTAPAAAGLPFRSVAVPVLELGLAPCRRAPRHWRPGAEAILPAAAGLPPAPVALPLRAGRLQARLRAGRPRSLGRRGVPAGGDPPSGRHPRGAGGVRAHRGERGASGAAVRSGGAAEPVRPHARPGRQAQAVGVLSRAERLRRGHDRPDRGPDRALRAGLRRPGARPQRHAAPRARAPQRQPRGRRHQRRTTGPCASCSPGPWRARFRIRLPCGGSTCALRRRPPAAESTACAGTSPPFRPSWSCACGAGAALPFGSVARRRSRARSGSRAMAGWPAR